MTQVDKQIEKLRQALAAMGDNARGMLDLGLRVLETRDPELAADVVRADRELNRFETELDHMCEQRLVLQEPFASDFRLIFSAIKTTRDLERIGDEVKVIARWGPRLAAPPSVELLAMARSSRDAVAAAVRAMVAMDVREAEKILVDDTRIDEFETLILSTTESIPEAFIAHALERVGDRATNIAENIIYAVRGKDVRHRKDG